MSHTAILTRAEIESMGPPLPEEITRHRHLRRFLCDLALKHVAMLPEPTTTGRRGTHQSTPHTHRGSAPEAVPGKADRSEDTVGDWFDALRDVGPRLGPAGATVINLRILGPAPVSLRDYSHMMRLQSIPSNTASIETVRSGISRSDIAGVVVADVGLCNQLASFVVSDRIAWHRKDCGCRANQQRAGRRHLDSIRGRD